MAVHLLLIDKFGTIVSDYWVGFFKVLILFYWLFLAIWVFSKASEFSKKEKDTSGTSFIFGLMKYGVIGIFLVWFTGMLADNGYAEFGVLIYGIHCYQLYRENEKNRK